MADTWGGIARAMEEGVSRNEARSAREEMYPGHLEAARDANAHGIIGLLSGRHRAFVEDNKTRMRELGITPSHRNLSNELTGRYSSGDWKALQDVLVRVQPGAAFYRVVLVSKSIEVRRCSISLFFHCTYSFIKLYVSS